MGNSKAEIDVSYVAQLARLELTDDQKTALQGDMEKILEYIDLLSELDVDGIEPTAHAAPLHNVTRDDVSRNSGIQEAILENAPALIEGELIKVPQIMPGQEEA